MNGSPWKVGKREVLVGLALLALAVIGVYAILIRMVAGVVRVAPPERHIAILAPSDGFLAQVGAQVEVKATVSGADLERIELWADEAPLFVATRTTPAGQSAWTVAGVWNIGWTGAHRCFARAFNASGEMVVSLPITLWAVPAGEIAFSTNREGTSYAIYRSRLDGAEIERVFSGQGDSREPAPRRTGSIALTQILAGQPRALWQIDLQDGKAGVLINDAANVYQATWSPDGQRLAFVSNRTGSDQLWIAAPDGTDSQIVTTEPSAAGYPAWHPRGIALAYTGKRADNWDIYRVNLDGTGLSRLTQASGIDWQPAWSPAGDQIAFVSDRSGEHQIYLMDANGNDQRPLTNLVGGAEQPRWSPDGAWIVFVGHSGQGEGFNARELYLMRSDGRDPIRLTYNAYDDTEPAWLWPANGESDRPLTPAPEAGNSVFRGSYYPNMTLSGEPVLERDDLGIEFDWGWGSPAPVLPADHFSILWTGTLNVAEAGDYLFEMSVDQGGRLFVDGQEVLSLWGGIRRGEQRVPWRLEAGQHQLLVEYYESEGPASITLRWWAVK